MSATIHTRQLNHEAYRALVNAGTDPLMARLFAARNIKNPIELEDKLSHLYPFELLKNNTQAAICLAQAIHKAKRILIVADYDADGATACAVAMLGLQSMGAVVDFLVPNRFEHGYGLTPPLVDIAAQRGAQLLMTVDNGMASISGVAHAQALGMEVLITDHHLAADTLPNCIIVNPNQPDCPFPSKSLAGVGVVFYVLMALRAHLRAEGYFHERRPEPKLADLLDLVALGTVADVVSLDHNNRILVAQGLKRMRAGWMRPGIRALFDVAKRDWKKAKPFDLGFAIGPRINAAGRLDDMSLGIACLLSEHHEAAHMLAEQLNNLNIERREIENGMLEEALAGLSDVWANHYSVVAYRDDWHQGVVGIVASRLRERYHRPTIVFAPAEHGELRGSGRSIGALHLRDALDTVSKRHCGLILKFGGHAMAAGLSIAEHDLARFEAAFEAVVSECLSHDDLNQHFLTDGSLSTEQLCLPQAIKLAEPVWGQGFQPPCFCDEFTVAWQRPVGTNHLKAGLSKNGHIVEAMFFRCTDTLPQNIRTVYRPVANEWRQNMELQLHIDYWECATNNPTP